MNNLVWTQALHGEEELRAARCDRPSEWDQIVFTNRLDLCHTSPDSGARQYSFKLLKRAV
jgi:hypothetical protein